MKAYCIKIDKPEQEEKNDPDPWVAMHNKDKYGCHRYITLDKDEAHEVHADLSMYCPDCIYTVIEFEVPA